MLGFFALIYKPLSWVPEVFLAYDGNFRCWPKADTSSAVGRSYQQRVTIKTWQKPETALEKSLEPRVINHYRNFLTPVEFKITIYDRNLELTLKMKPLHLCLLKQCMIVTTYIFIDPKKSWLCNVCLLHSSRKIIRKTWGFFLINLPKSPDAVFFSL